MPKRRRTSARKIEAGSSPRPLSESADSPGGRYSGFQVRDVPSEAELPLTERDLDVLRLIADGKYKKQVAVELGISIYTVQAHCAHIRAKLGAQNMTHAVSLAFRAKILE